VQFDGFWGNSTERTLLYTAYENYLVAREPIVINGLRLKANGYSVPEGSRHYPSLQVSVGYAASPIYQNIGSDWAPSTQPTVVYDGEFTATWTPTVGDYDIYIPFSTPVLYDPAVGHLGVMFEVTPTEFVSGDDFSLAMWDPADGRASVIQVKFGHGAYPNETNGLDMELVTSPDVQVIAPTNFPEGQAAASIAPPRQAPSQSTTNRLISTYAPTYFGSTSPMTIKSLTYRVQQTSGITPDKLNIKFYMGYVDSGYAIQSGDDIFARVPDRELVFDGSWGITYTATANDFDLPLQLETPFHYDPEKGALAIIMEVLTPSGFSSQTFSLQCKADGTTGNLAWSSDVGGADSTIVTANGICPLSVELSGFVTEPVTGYNNVAWRQYSPGSWLSQCLPFPRALAEGNDNFDPHIPMLNVPRVNSSGIVAGVVDQGTGFGTAVVWCPGGNQFNPTYSERALTVSLPDAVGAPVDTLVAAVVTDITDDGVILGAYVASSGERCRLARPVVWEPIEGNGCLFGWRGRALDSTPAPGVCSETSEIAVGISPTGNVVTSWSVAGQNPRVRFWPYSDGTWVAGHEGQGWNSAADYGFLSQGTLKVFDGSRMLISGFDVGGYPYLSSGFFAADFVSLPNESDVPLAFTRANAILGMSAVDARTTDMWVMSGNERSTIERLSASRQYGMPLYGNTAGLIAGVDFNVTEAPYQGLGRVWVTESCSVGSSDTPRLLDWKVTYRTDKNPSWGFDVEVADMCMTSVTNSSDISTATPEITTSNNTSDATMSVNTADLVVALELESNVVSPGDYIYGEAEISNAGPGTARDVYFWMEPPDGCEFSYADLDSVISVDYFDYGVDYIEAQFYDVPFMDGEPVATVSFECEIYTEEADFSMAINAALESPTIDCNAGNDAATQTAVIGNYPNLWVTLEGPPSGVVNVPVPYDLALGNNGNEDGNGTIVVTLPPGTFFELDCSRIVHPEAFVTDECLPEGLAIEIIQPTATEPGTVTIIPTVEEWRDEVDATFSDGEDYDVPFTLTWLDCGAGNATAELQAVVNPVDPDANFADNAANTETFIVSPAGELALTVVPSDTRAEVGSELFYTFYFANNGSVAAVGTELEFRLPDGLAIQSVVPEHENDNGFFAVGRGSAVDGEGNFVKSLLPTDSGAVTVRVLVTGPVSGTGLVTLHTTSGACEASAPITGPTIAPSENPGLHVLVSSSTGSACGEDGGTVNWTVTVTNPGMSAARATPVSIVIPAGLTYVPGSIKGQGGIDVSAPNLLWLADIPAQGALSFTFSTTVVSDTLGVLTLPASAGSAQGIGSLAIDCGERVVVNKAWDLVCGLAGDTFTITASVTNKTSEPISGTLWDTFQTGVTGQFEGQTAEFVVEQLLPGATYTTTFDVVVGEPLGFGDPLFDRVVFDSNTTVQAASNQVGGAIITCATPGQCQSNTCEPLLGCVTITEPYNPEVPERCDNQLDDNCNGEVNEGFGNLGLACDGEDSDECELGTWTCAGTTLECTESEQRRRGLRRARQRLRRPGRRDLDAHRGRARRASSWATRATATSPTATSARTTSTAAAPTTTRPSRVPRSCRRRPRPATVSTTTATSRSTRPSSWRRST
jgi:uncharacterized repeat protein (TIGR01451 family)